MPGVAYVNGTIGPIEEARVPIEDRGLQFGHSVYEVVHAVHGAYFRFQQHMARLERSLQAAAIPMPAGTDALVENALRLLKTSGEREGALYIQITAGAAPRSHVPPPGSRSTLIMTFRPHARTGDHRVEQDVRLITHPDTRWARRDIKATTLLPNVLMRLEAARQGAHEALLYEGDGVITECSAANFFAVVDGNLRTHPGNERILHGVTRGVVLEVCRALRIDHEEVAIRLGDLPRATEAFITGTILGIAPVCQIDQTWQRSPGQVTKRVQDAYWELVQRETNATHVAGG